MGGGSQAPSEGGGNPLQLPAAALSGSKGKK